MAQYKSRVEFSKVMKLGFTLLSIAILFASALAFFTFSPRCEAQRQWLIRQPFVRFFLDRVNRPALVISSVLTVCLFIVEIFLFHRSYCSQSNGNTYLNELARHSLLWEMFFHAIVVGVSLLLFSAFAYWALTSRPACRVVYFLIFAIPVFAEYSTQRSLSRFTDAEDIKMFVLVTNFEMQTDAIKMFLSWLGLVPCAAFALCLLFFKIPKRSSGAKGMVAVLIVVLGFYLLLGRQDVLYKNYVKYPVVSFNAFFRTLADYARLTTSSRDRKRETVVSDPTAQRPNNNIIFVVDESVRGDHLSLNGYGRKTTPHLENLFDKGVLQNWGIATSVTTCSESSGLLLMTGLTLQDLPDDEGRAYENPTIFQYAKAMGYCTYFIDGQMDVLWSLKPADMKYVDEWWNLNRFLEINDDRMQVDFVIAETVRKIVENSTGNFIWVIKSGAHFPYYKRFPETEAEWTPFFASDRGGEKAPDLLANSYDNAIKYNLEGFFKNLIPDFKPPANTTVVYTSDHGETVGQNGDPNFHCGVTRSEVMVPLFIIGYDQSDIDTKFRASHENIFATLLDLMQVPQSMRRRQYGLSLLQAREADSTSRFYVGPGLLSKDKFRFD